mmetsp:Transcript_12397/g.20825  ORF Transcript_12397/g.20825 Transcript_12397/m.20825 type:complete len:221 (+) Transcript_12397:1050-1712(+)
MVPTSILQIYGSVAGPMASHLTAAAVCDDPLQRMKHVITASLAFLYPCHSWGKPLNPILGETYQGYLPDGSMISVEQISHHPPISYIILEGPDGLYRFSGYSDFAIKAWWNSINLEVKGVKRVQFKDGSQIEYNNQHDKFGNTLMGTCHHMLLGQITFTDQKNGLEGFIDIGSTKKKPRDYLEGHIKRHGEKVCERIFGTYMGYIDFDGERYLDLRAAEN